MQRLSLNILPEGISILQVLIKQTDIFQQFMDFSQPFLDDRTKFEFRIPYVMNFHNKGFLDIPIERCDTKAANLALEYLIGYGIDHHSRYINHLIPELVELPNFVPYLESRMIKTDVTRSI